MLDIPKNQKSLISLFFVDPRSREPGIGTGYWMLDTGYWMLDAGYWMLDAGCWILDAGCWIAIHNP